MLTIDTDDIDLLLPIIKWARDQACDSRGEPFAYSAAKPICAWAMAKLDEVVGRLEQYLADEEAEKNDV